MNTYIGQRFGDYRLTEYRGSGGFAEVYLGQHVHLEKKWAAIKILKGVFTQEEIEKFREEAEKIDALDHPNIVHLITFSTRKFNGQDIPFLVMDYAPGGSLSKRHPRGTQIPLETLLSYVKPLAAALQYAHDQKVIHRDIKPANFLLGKDKKVLLSDFGIAVDMHSTQSWEEQNYAGTPIYMAPEQFKAHAKPASDQYSLGVVVYEWLCGQPPFVGDPIALAYQHAEVPPPPLGIYASPTVEAVVLRALEKDPQNRFPCIRDFADALEMAYKEEIERLLSTAEYTADLLSSVSVQQMLLDIIIAKPDWWKNEGAPKILALSKQGEQETGNTIATVLSALAMKAVSKAITAIEGNEYATFQTMLLLISFAYPSFSRPCSMDKAFTRSRSRSTIRYRTLGSIFLVAKTLVRHITSHKQRAY